MALYTQHVTEQRLTTRLMSVWEKLKGAEEMPLYSRLNPDAISDMWQNCFVVSKAGAEKPIYKYEYVGDAIMQAYGKNPKDDYLSTAIRNVPGAIICTKMDEVIKARKPLLDEGQFINDKSKVVKYRGCLLPYRNAANEVSHILVGLSWRAF